MPCSSLTKRFRRFSFVFLANYRFRNQLRLQATFIVNCELLKDYPSDLSYDIVIGYDGHES